ncbi:acetyl-CoA synthetase-like protein [Aspergillus ambiguus]|uniref:acetyl-CoA synthetase-like protein n=1 Tax=Aspergillus ambiguus TaxID=176160 RepID=UPI003CCD0240
MAVNDSFPQKARAQLLPNIVDHYAQVKPDAIYAEYPRSPYTYDEGYIQVTYMDFANAINGFAKWLTERFGPGNGEILAYIGPSDLRYPALVLGAVKAGYCIFVPSPRNSAAAHQKLFEKLNCTKLLVPNPPPAALTTVLEAQKVDVHETLTVDELLESHYPHFGYNKSYPDAANDRLVVLHTSGSTGLPKPIVWTHDTACKQMHMASLDAPDGLVTHDTMYRGSRLFLTLPPFHAAGIAYLTTIGIPAGMTLVLPISGVVPTAAGMVSAMKQTTVDVGLVVPSLVQELGRSPDLLDYCGQHLKYVMYCGGDLPEIVGDKVASTVGLVNLYGASELGMLSLLHGQPNRNPQKDWRYVQFNPRLGVHFRQENGNEFELSIIRSPDSEAHQTPFTIFPELDEYATRDLWVRHPDPTKANLWRWSARRDDVIVFLNGEKTNPISMEQRIAFANPEVSAVLVAGAQRFQACLLIELKGKKPLSPTEKEAAIERLWPSVEEANKDSPAHARIAKTHLLFTHPDKPMARSAKATIQRAQTMALYANELDSLYEDVNMLAKEKCEVTIGPGKTKDAIAISEYIRKSLAAISGVSEGKLIDEANLFQLGLDSLQTIIAARRFNVAFDLPAITPACLYLNPSISQLTKLILRRQRHIAGNEETSITELMNERDHTLKAHLARLDTSSKHTVILTGSTGRLGAYLLDALMRNPSVEHIYCLNRALDSAQLQRQRSALLCLPSAFEKSRVTFWTADLSRPDLKLSQEAFATLRGSSTMVIHNAWPVNFNMPLASFDAQLVGVVNLIKFCSSATKSPRLFFISSISSVMGHQSETKVVPERVIATNNPGPNGYANSKYVAEHIISQAAQTNLVRASIVRVGQVAGAIRTAGAWNRAEWFPSMVLSSLHIGALPETIGGVIDRIDWVPIDSLASILTELALGEKSSHYDGVPEVLHVVNTNPVAWETMRSWLVDTLSQDCCTRLETIPFESWFKRVRQDAESFRHSEGIADDELESILQKNPAANLLGFFESMASVSSPIEDVFDTRLTREKSQTLRTLVGVQREWIEKWVNEWL